VQTEFYLKRTEIKPLLSPDYYKSILKHSGAKRSSASGHQTPFSSNSWT
jgi:hypothetical protein